MKRILRVVLIASTVAAPFALTGATSPASATCRPEKPSTCEVYCPSGDWIYAGPVKICVPANDQIDIQQPALP